ncbi:MAG: hypothetical protein CVU29_05785 [Betaproteobacteria bacterium HGW-Betaproteobacteria-22]|nr:MAG: hypothetical protein CVU29_05785 [Betaproteobacteria bacterium HGW-Betaproteobacteria-22]
MKPVRRRIRRHFGLTARQVAVRSQRPWYFQVGVILFLLGLGYSGAYLQFSGGYEKVGKLTLENQAINTNLIKLERQLQIEQAAQVNLNKELKEVQDENIHLKEDLAFYKNMLDSKK